MTAVSLDGRVRELEIPSFVHAEQIIFDEHKNEPMLYHVQHRTAAGHVVNVPPYSNMGPDTNAPSIIGWTAYLIECGESAAFHQMDPAALAQMTPERVVEEYPGWLKA